MGLMHTRLRKLRSNLLFPWKDHHWLCEYDIELKSQKKTGKQKMNHDGKNVEKVDQKSKSCSIHGVVNHEFLPPGLTANAFYVDVLMRWRDRVWCVRPNFCGGDGWLCIITNAPAHSSVIIQEFLTRKSITSRFLFASEM